MEICYAAGIGDTASRRNIISNAMGLWRGTRGRGLLVSSEARRAAELRGPYDVVNLVTFWGVKKLESEIGRRVVLHSEARRLTYKGAVQVVTEEVKEMEKREEERPKRKVTPVDLDESIEVQEGGGGKRGKPGFGFPRFPRTRHLHGPPAPLSEWRKRRLHFALPQQPRLGGVHLACARGVAHRLRLAFQLCQA